MQDDSGSQRKPEGEITDRCVQAQDARKAVRQRVFTRWINVFLQRRDPPIQVLDLFKDVQDGRILMALLEELSGCRLLYRFRSSSHRIFRLNNISKALAFLDDRHVKLVGIDASGISDGTPSIVLNLIWNIILHFQVKEMMGGLQRHLSSSLSCLSVSTSPSFDDLSPRADDPGSYCSNTLPSKGRRAAGEPKYHGKALKSLLQWVQRCTSKYGIDVNDFGRSWRSGLPFLGLIKSINPDLVDLRESLSKDPRENVQEAFAIARRSLDIPPLLEAEDVTCTSPDEKSIITYVSMFLRLHPSTHTNPATSLEISEIPNFGSPETVSLGETFSDDPEALAFLKGLERSSEQLLWKRWSRKSGSTRPALFCTNGAATSEVFIKKREQSVAERPSGPLIKKAERSRGFLQPPSPLDATVISPEIQSWMEMDPSEGHSRQTSHDNHVSLSSEEGTYTLPMLDSDEEDAYSYILDLNKEVFQPYHQLKSRVPKVEEETAEEMIEESKDPEASQIFTGSQGSCAGQNEDLDQDSLVEAESDVHGKFYLVMNESNLEGRANNGIESEREGGSGRKEQRHQGRAAGEESSSDGGSEEAEEKKMENVRLVKEVSDEISDDEAREKVSKVARWQKSVWDGKGALSERQASERRVLREGDERGHLARSENVNNLGDVGEGSEVRENEQRELLEACEVGRSRVCGCGDGRRAIKTRQDVEETRETESNKERETAAESRGGGADIRRGDETLTPACRAASDTISDGRFIPHSPAVSCDITPLELEVLFVLWILAYCCLVLPQLNL